MHHLQQLGYMAVSLNVISVELWFANMEDAVKLISKRDHRVVRRTSLALTRLPVLIFIILLVIGPTECSALFERPFPAGLDLPPAMTCWCHVAAPRLDISHKSNTGNTLKMLRRHTGIR